MTDQTVNPVVRFNNVRLGFPHLYQPHVNPNFPEGKPSYSADVIIDNAKDGGAQWKACEATISAMAAAKWPDISAQVLAHIHGDSKLRCFGKGEEKLDKTTMLPRDGYKGMLFVSGRNTDLAPDLFDQQGKQIDPTNALDTESPKFYGGCYVNAAVKFWLQDNQYGRAIRCELVALQFLADGTPFANHKVDTSAMFAPVEGAPAATAGSFEPEPEAPTNPVSFA